MNDTAVDNDVINTIKDVGLYIYPELIDAGIVERLKSQTLSLAWCVNEAE